LKEFVSVNSSVSLKAEILNASVLRKLEVVGSQIESIPKTWAGFQSMEYLNLGSLLQRFNGTFLLSSLTLLFSLASNSLSDLECIASMSKLTYLALQSNQFKLLPSGITQCVNLTYLDLSSNQITGLSEALAALNSLTYVHPQC